MSQNSGGAVNEVQIDNINIGRIEVSDMWSTHKMQLNQDGLESINL